MSASLDLGDSADSCTFPNRFLVQSSVRDTATGEDLSDSADFGNLMYRRCIALNLNKYRLVHMISGAI